MSDESTTPVKNQQGGKKNDNNNGIFGFVYFLTIIGAAVYFIQHSTSFWGGVLGFLKALIWPLLVTYKVLDLLKM